MHAYSQFEEEQRQQAEREHANYFRGSSGYSRGFSRADPLGYYEALGVEPGASKEEIQVSIALTPAIKRHVQEPSLRPPSAFEVLSMEWCRCCHSPC